MITLLHSERSKLHRVLAVLSAIGWPSQSKRQGVFIRAAAFIWIDMVWHLTCMYERHISVNNVFFEVKWQDWWSYHFWKWPNFSLASFMCFVISPPVYHLQSQNFVNTLLFTVENYFFIWKTSCFTDDYNQVPYIVLVGYIKQNLFLA